MSNSKKDKIILLNEWKVQVDEWEKSELSIREWCHQNNIPATTFSYRLKKVKTELIAETNSIVENDLSCNYAHNSNINIPIQIAKIELEPNSEKDPSIRINTKHGSIDIFKTASIEMLKTICEVLCHA